VAEHELLVAKLASFSNICTFSSFQPQNALLACNFYYRAGRRGRIVIHACRISAMQGERLGENTTPGRSKDSNVS
jgi:hypothetical protein